ncbi:MAG: hypothetical protein H0W05_03450, partial [Thermoleophilaceae bacterium]|nr:hypothetical protein [Thermoleophilaceae bacterium]
VPAAGAEGTPSVEQPEPAAAGAAPPAQHAEETERPPEDAPSGEGANRTPDPFRPLQ